MSACVVRIIDLLHEPIVFLNILALDCLPLHVDETNKPRFEVEPLDVVLASFGVLDNPINELFESLDHHYSYPFTVKIIFKCFLNLKLELT
jgi:hypothetical protein